MDFWSEIEEAVGEVIDRFKKPPEPLVLGAELWCPYGSEHTYLMLERDDIDIDNLPQANVDDCKKSVNIFPFGECAGGSLCEYRMELEKQWENPEPQTEIVNGKEVVTTKSVLLCRAGGMEIQAANSGQEFGKKLAEQINLKIKMDAEYPGLYDLLTDPYGSLYLNEGMYETALAFLADRMTDKGDIFLPAVFDGNDLENEMVRLALGKLMPRCDVSTYDRFINGLEDTGLLTGMNEKEGWDVHYLNNEMMEMLRKDCKTTDERVRTDPEIRWQEENRIFTSSMSDAMTQLSKAVVMYLAMKPQQSTEKIVENKVSKKNESLKNEAKIARGNSSDIRNRIGNPVKTMDKTYEMALDPELYANEVAKKYGINLRGVGQKINISYNAEIVSAGKTCAMNPTVIELGPSAFVSEEELANTIAHELNHARSFLKGGSAPEWGIGGAYPAGDALAEYIRGVR